MRADQGETVSGGRKEWVLEAKNQNSIMILKRDRDSHHTVDLIDKETEWA